MRIAKRIGLLLVVVSSSLGASCPLTKASGDIKDATKNLEDGLKSVSDGMNNLDPLALKTLLSENKTLRDQIAAITKSLNAAAGGGMIEVDNRAVRIRVESYTGAFVLSAWVDVPENAFWRDVTLTMNPGFTFGDRASRTALVGESRVRSARQPPPFGGDGSASDNVSWATLEVAETRFQRYLSAGTFVPGPQTEPIDLNTSFGGVSGVHKVYIQVTPTAVDSTGQWGIRFQTVLRPASGDEERVRLFEVTKSGHPNAPLNAAIPPIEQVLNVKIGA